MAHWHQIHKDGYNFGEKLADIVATFMGSWKFIIIQTLIVFVWIIVNIVGFLSHWDAYPFILLNLIFSTQAAYSAPVIMQSQNRQSERDRHHAEADYQCNLAAKNEIEHLQNQLAQIEIHKLDKIISLLEQVTPPTVTGTVRTSSKKS
jgi:uncharacterized membrane protein